MSVREVKIELHEQIEALTDEQTLRVYEFVKTQNGQDEDFDANSPDVMAKIENTLANVGKGKTHTTEEILTFINEWSTR